MRRWHLGMLVVLMLTLTAAAVPLLDEAIWTDEQRTLWYAGAAPQYGPGSLTISIERIADNRWQAPAYFLVMWGWGRLVGWTVEAMRAFSLLTGMLALAGVYAVGRAYFNRDVGLYAAFLLGAAAFYVNFLHDMRGYTLFVGAGALALWAYRYAHQRAGLLPLVVLALALTLLPYTHYFMGFLLAGMGVAHLVFGRREPRFWAILGCFVLAGVFFLPWANVFIAGASLSAQAGQRVDNMSVFEAVWGVLRMFANGSYALLLVLVFIGFAGRDHYQARRYLWLVLFTGLALALGATRVFRILNEVRYLIFLWVPLALAAALGLYDLRRLRYAPGLVLAAWAVGFGYGLASPDFQREIYAWATPAFDQITDAIHPHATEDDALIYLMPTHDHVVELDAVLGHYLYDTPLYDQTLIHDTYAMTDNAYIGFVQGAAAGARRAWLGYHPQDRPWRAGPVVQNVLPEMGFTDCGPALASDDVTLHLFASPPAGTQRATFTEDNTPRAELVLLGDPATNREHITLPLGWELLPGAEPLYSVGIHAENAAGQVVAQADYGIEPDGFGCAFVSLGIAGWEPGRYTLHGLVYHWGTGERLTLAGERTVRTPLGTVEITR